MVDLKKDLRDLGLSYHEAAHGVQSALALQESKGAKLLTPKHMRVGIDMSKSDHGALVDLLISTGIIKHEDYLEALRLYANDELAEWQELEGMTFR